MYVEIQSGSQKKKILNNDFSFCIFLIELVFIFIINITRFRYASNKLTQFFILPLFSI